MTNEPLPLRQLEVFVALAERGSFTKAAATLGLSQSTVSGHFAELERRLDLRLVERGRRGVRLTPGGAELLGTAREALRAERAVRLAAEDVCGLMRGRLAIGGSTIPSSCLLPQYVADFRREHPDVRVQVRTADSDAVLELLREGGVELAVVGRRPPDPAVWAVPIVEDTLVLICPPDHALARAGAIGLRDVAEHPLVAREEGSGTRAALEAALMVQVGPALSFDVAFEAGDTQSVKAAVRAGVGVSFVSDLAVRDEVAAGALVAVTLGDFDVRRWFYAAAYEARLAPAGRAFMDQLVRSAGGVGPVERPVDLPVEPPKERSGRGRSARG